MAKSSWKQREIVNRQKEYLQKARQLLLKKGYLGFSMDRLAETTEYSKGTLYQHFRSKEDVLVELALEMEHTRFTLLQRASAFVGWTRERMLAMGVAHEILHRLNPDYMQIEEVVVTASVREKLEPERRDALDHVITRAAETGLGVIRDAMAEGDLTPPYQLTAEQVLLTLLGTSSGLRTLWSAAWWDRRWAPDVPLLNNHLLNVICDGLNWRPLGADWNYDATVERIWTEVYPQERDIISAMVT